MSSNRVMFVELATRAASNMDAEWEKALREAALRAEFEERAELDQRRCERASRVKQRQGRGHDPRRQVICRSRVQSRGKGRR